MIVLEPVGFVHNSYTDSQTPELIKKEISKIEILPEYAEGLQDIEQAEYIDLVFSFHREKRTELLTRVRSGEIRGIFASRSPKRPNHLGITTVKLKKKEGNTLYVEGADALNGSPVLDIKYCDTSVFDQQHIHRSVQADSPRLDIIRHILSGDTSELLLKAAQLHGHICPGLALGVMGATKILQQLYEEGEEINDYTLTVEMKNCLVDGILFVTGCTPGNHRFIQSDKDTSCFYLLNSTGKGKRLRLKPSHRNYLKQHLPDDISATEKGFLTLRLDCNELFQTDTL